MTDILLFEGIDEPGLATIDVYERRGGYQSLRKALQTPQPELVETFKGSGLRGRGGAGFNMGMKASFLPKGDMQKYVVVNADESEPGTFKDRELLQKNPHQLIEGIIIAAFAVGATKTFVYIRGEYELQADILDAAIAEAYEKGYLGENILGSGFDVSLHCSRGAGAYICGEETALLDSLEGKRGNPRLKPPFPANQGLFQGPTLINNVETLSTLPHIVRLGAERYAEIGVENSAGTKLVSVSGNVQRPGNYEIELGMSSRDIIYGLAGGPPEGREVKLWFPGGSSSPVLTKDDLDLSYDFDTLAKAGTMLGSGAIIVVDDSQSVVDVALWTAKFYAHESCGKCTPCREGTNWTHKMLQRVKEGTATPMDLDIMAGVQEQIIGHCLCVLGDAMAMPIGSMIKKFRGEFEEYIEAARAERERQLMAGVLSVVPRPVQEMITFTLDGREVTAPQNMMLADAALEYGDVEIPVFCYEPKIGPPVGACRMCLVEVEGIPKLQAGCATPVKDGMVVHTGTPKVKAAQEAVLEFLLINHPLDCPVCDKGGECPLQDKSFGWGGGLSRFVEPKRHFEKPLALSPLIAIDRERCILCYRCVRYSQEVAEDAQLVLHERGAHTFVGTFDGHPYVAPFSGNIIELCPVGALTSRPYRFRARPWDIEQSGSVCTLCPAQCNVSFTVRDDRVLRVLQRDNEGVDDGWLCDKGRFAYQAIHVDERVTQPLIRDGGELRPVSWEHAIETAAAGLGRAVGRTGALAGGEASNEEGWLLAQLLRGALQSGDLDSRAGGALPLDLHRALLAPALGATVPDLQYAHAVLVLDTEPVDDAPILDLRIRKGVRHHGVKLFVATSRPSALDPRATQSVRFAPGAGEAFVAALDAALTGEGDLGALADAAGTTADELRLLVEGLRAAGEEVVVLWGERLTHGPRGAQAARGLLNVASRLGLADRPGAGLLEVPAGANGRGLREAGVLPNAGPGLSDPAAEGRDAPAIAAAAAAGDLTALYLLRTDPLLDQPDAAGWDAALEKASTVIAHAAFVTEGLRRHATVIFPAESYAEKEGTLVHPDGRLQRLRRAIGRAGETRAEWQVLAELSKRLGNDLGLLTSSMVTQRLFAEVPFWAGLDLDAIGGRGVRWPEREPAAAFPGADRGPFAPEVPAAAPSPNGRLRLGTFRSIWAAPEVEASPALKFLHPRQRVELSPEDARRLELQQGDTVLVGSDGHSVRGTVHVRAGAPAGSVFLETALAEDSAATLEGPLVEVRRP